MEHKETFEKNQLPSKDDVIGEKHEDIIGSDLELDKNTLEKSEIKKKGVFPSTENENTGILYHAKGNDVVVAGLVEQKGACEREVVEKGKLVYTEHWKKSKIQDSLNKGTLIKGKFEASPTDYLEGFVTMEGDADSGTKLVCIQGLKHLNRAIHGDIVAVELILQENVHTYPSKYIDEKSGHVKSDESEGSTHESKNKSKMKSGMIVGIIQQNRRPYCGMLKPSPSNEQGKQASHCLFVPAEKRIPYIRVPSQEKEKLSQKWIVSIYDWPSHSRYPHGHFMRSLGKVGDKNTEIEVLLLENEIRYKPFSEAVLDCLPELPWVITEKDLAVRRDLKHLVIYSVDPPFCKDIDDALHCRQLENGNYEVGIHIADVSHFIKAATAIDIEAKRRLFTVYLVNKKIHMLPEILSTNLCSLLENEDRFAFTIILEMTKEAVILSSTFFKSIIRSKASLSYDEAQSLIDDESINSEIARSLRMLSQLAKVLKKKRINMGAILLPSTELQFVIDSETHDPIDVKKKELKDAHSMVEEFMLLCNTSVAKRIYATFPECALLRRHPMPSLSKFEPLIKAALSKGFKIDVHSEKAFAASFYATVIPEHPYFTKLIGIIATRCIGQASYCCSGNETDFAHFGLAASPYTHFTSPIRRYSDLIVHRLLAVAIGAAVTYPSLVDKNKTQELCNNLNNSYKKTKSCERSSVNLYRHIMLKDRIVEEEGYLLFVRVNSVEVFLPRLDLECTLYLRDNRKSDGHTNFTFNEEGPSQSAGGVTLCQFDAVTVRLWIDKSNVQHPKTMLKLVQPIIPGFSVSSLMEEPPMKKQKSL